MIRLPFVSRATFDVMHARAQHADLVHNEAIRGRLSVEALYDSLLTKYHQLKLQGFTAPAPDPRLSQASATIASPVARAIDSVPAARDPKNRSAMWDQVEADRANGVSEEEIIMRIRRGNRPAEESV